LNGIRVSKEKQHHHLNHLMTSKQLQRDFFNRDTINVARDLLGTQLVRLENGQRLAGVIIETEAYRGEEDLACHARSGMTPRTEVMYGPPGHAYVYLNYGIHWLLNFVTEAKGKPAAVLIRGLEPTEGLEVIARRRDGRPRPEWTNGPAKLTQALSIDKRFSKADHCVPDAQLFVEAGERVPDRDVITGPRVGIDSVPEPWRSIPWRFKLKS
jgi:DNA-3-methyladenine glycosylase